MRDINDLSLRADTTLLIVFSIILAMVLVSVAILPSNSTGDLTGVVGSIDNADVTSRMNPISGAIYGIGDVFCHQMLSRSLVVDGNQMPICTRDLGIIFGIVFGMAVAILFDPRFSPLLLLLMLMPMALDGGAQLLTEYESFNSLRLITGAIAGAGLALFMSTVSKEMLGGGTSRRGRS